jgi:hypothetical protein
VPLQLLNTAGTRKFNVEFGPTEVGEELESFPPPFLQDGSGKVHDQKVLS